MKNKKLKLFEEDFEEEGIENLAPEELEDELFKEEKISSEDQEDQGLDLEKLMQDSAQSNELENALNGQTPKIEELKSKFEFDSDEWITMGRA